jgi:hypothetical protein
MKTSLYLVLCAVGLAGCSNSNMDDGLKRFLSDIAENVSRDDCDVYTRNTSAYDECMSQVDASYKDNN